MEEKKPRYLTPEEIDAAVRALSEKEGRYISRGRGGDGLGQRGGVFFRIYVEENDDEEYPFASEAELRRFLSGLDVDNFSNRYYRWVLEGLGALK